MALANDNWYGFPESWIYEQGVTWMEKAVASPYWTGMLFISIDSLHGSRRKHNMNLPMFSHEGRTAYKGQLFSAPLDWQSCLHQLQQMENSEEQIALPVMGAVLEARVSIVISAGLTDLNTL